jgi:hypothetical protein
MTAQPDNATFLMRQNHRFVGSTKLADNWERGQSGDPVDNMQVYESKCTHTADIHTPRSQRVTSDVLCVHLLLRRSAVANSAHRILSCEHDVGSSSIAGSSSMDPAASLDPLRKTSSMKHS